MFGRTDAAEIRDPADIPQQPDRWAIGGTGADFRIFGQRFQRRQIIAFAHTGQPVVIRPLLKRLQQPLDRSELQPGIAPLQARYRAEPMVFNGLNGFIVQRQRLACHPETARRHMAARAARDLRQLVRGQMPHPRAVIFDQRRKRDMGDIQVQAHPNRVSGHQIIDIAVLV